MRSVAACCPPQYAGDGLLANQIDKSDEDDRNGASRFYFADFYSDRSSNAAILTGGAGVRLPVRTCI